MAGPELLSHVHVSYSNDICLRKGQFIFPESVQHTLVGFGEGGKKGHLTMHRIFPLLLLRGALLGRAPVQLW